MDPDRDRLEAAYRATTYRVATAGGPLEIRVGESEPALDATSWAFVSAANPGSRPASRADNERAHAALLARVHDGGWQSREGAGLPAAAGWAPERSQFIAGIGRTDALRLGREFRQNAILVGVAGGPAAFAWLE